MQLERQRNPTICHLQAGEPEKPVVSFSLKPKASEPGESDNLIPGVQRPKNQELQQKQTSQLKKREGLYPFSDFSSYSGPRQFGSCPSTPVKAKFSLLNHVFISSNTTLPDTPRSSVLPAVWASLRPEKLTHKINQHSYIGHASCAHYRLQSNH